MKKYYAVQQAENAEEVDIYIFGDIVTEEWCPSEVSASGLIQQIGALQVQTINVHIDSYGGAVSEGWAIYNALRAHPATVNTYGDGFVASAALFPFLAGDNRFASSVSAYFLHQVMTGANGYAKDLRAAANEADILTGVGINAFVERTGMTAEQVSEMMDAETWLDANQALSLGIATAIIADGTPKYQQDAKAAIFRQLWQNHPKIQTPKPKTNKVLQLFERG